MVAEDLAETKVKWLDLVGYDARERNSFKWKTITLSKDSK